VTVHGLGSASATRGVKSVMTRLQARARPHTARRIATTHLHKAESEETVRTSERYADVRGLES
jgi:hypothetical protein